MERYIHGFGQRLLAALAQMEAVVGSVFGSQVAVPGGEGRARVDEKDPVLLGQNRKSRVDLPPGLVPVLVVVVDGQEREEDDGY